ncbi:hypothetical protein NQP46_14570 [Streptomyces albus]|nr:hypothetical protein NQP46_14570 [Streptomyces albus]
MIESPPRSKKLSSTPTRSTPRISAQMPASSCSVSVRGAVYAVVSAVKWGAGRAARSSLLKRR